MPYRSVVKPVSHCWTRAHPPSSAKQSNSDCNGWKRIDCAHNTSTLKCVHMYVYTHTKHKHKNTRDWACIHSHAHAHTHTHTHHTHRHTEDAKATRKSYKYGSILLTLLICLRHSYSLLQPDMHGTEGKFCLSRLKPSSPESDLPWLLQDVGLLSSLLELGDPTQKCESQQVYSLETLKGKLCWVETVRGKERLIELNISEDQVKNSIGRRSLN